MEQTAMQLAIEKIDEQIEIEQVCRIEASKIKDATSMQRHHAKKIALVFIRQELTNLLEMEKEQIIDAYINGRLDSDNIVMSKSFYAEQYYNETFKKK